MFKGEVQFFALTCGGKSLLLCDGIDNIHTKSKNSLFQPEPHDLRDSFPNLFIFPVQITLIWCKQGQIEFIRIRILLPGTSAESAEPIVWTKLVSFFISSSFFVDGIIPVRRIFAFYGLLKPNMLIRGVVCVYLPDDSNISLFCFLSELIKIFHGAK